VLSLQVLSRQRIVHQIDLTDGHVVGSPPIAVDVSDFLVVEHRSIPAWTPADLRSNRSIALGQQRLGRGPGGIVEPSDASNFACSLPASTDRTTIPIFVTLEKRCAASKSARPVPDRIDADQSNDRACHRICADDVLMMFNANIDCNCLTAVVPVR
jgi:hypothetical protein